MWRFESVIFEAVEDNIVKYQAIFVQTLLKNDLKIMFFD